MKEVVNQKSHFTLALASLAASASAAMARWRFSGNRASLLQDKYQLQKGDAMKSYIRVTLSIKIGECFTFLLFPLLFPSLQWPRPASSIKNHLFWWRSIVMWVTTCMAPAILSLSLRISWRFFVPRIFLSDVCASSLQENGLLIKNSELFFKNLLRAVMRVLHVCHAHDGVGHAVVDHGVHWHRHAVLCQQLHCEWDEASKN